MKWSYFQLSSVSMDGIRVFILNSKTINCAWKTIYQQAELKLTHDSTETYVVFKYIGNSNYFKIITKSKKRGGFITIIINGSKIFLLNITLDIANKLRCFILYLQLKDLS
jgi:hypothetical protein